MTERTLLLIASLLSVSFIATAQTANDTLTVHELKEVIVTSQNHMAVKDGVAYIPTSEEKRHSNNAISLLERMMVAGLHIDRAQNKVQTSWYSNVKIFIDGIEATETDFKTLRPKEVVKVEYLLSPADPKFKNYDAVVNFELRKYIYGGYVSAQWKQGFINKFGDYTVAGKLKNGKMTYQMALETYYRDADDIMGHGEKTFVFSSNRTVKKATNYHTDMNTQMYVGNFRMRYDSKNLVWLLGTGLKTDRTPRKNSVGEVFYSGVDEPTASSMTENGKSRTIIPYMEGQIQIHELPFKSTLFGGFSFSYNRNNSNTIYTSTSEALTTSIPNGYRENAYLPNVFLEWSLLVSKKNNLTFMANLMSEIYRTQYSGTDDSYQKLTNSYYTFNMRYDHTFSDQWNGSVCVGMPIESYKMNGESYNTTPFLNGYFYLNGRIGTKHSLYMKVGIDQNQVNPSYYNSVIRKENEIEGTKGNADLKTEQQIYAVLSYTWIPSDMFSLNANVYWDNITDDVVPWYHPVDGLMIKEMVNSGDYNPVYFSLTPSLILCGRKLRINSKISYCREWHTGLYKHNLEYIGWYPSMSYDFNSHFSANVGYNCSVGDAAYMRGSSERSVFSNNFMLGMQYTIGNFYAGVQVNSLFKKYGYVKSWLDMEHLSMSEYISRPWDGRYLTVSVSYTFDFGKRMKHGNNLYFRGISKSSTL